MESQKEVQITGGKGSQDEGESSHYPSHRRTTEPERAYCNSCRITRSEPTRLTSCLKPFRHQKISDQESPFYTIPGTVKEKTRIKRKKKTYLKKRKKE
ncbi:hypothetical protein O181_010129 [Austropuccinia psidii MF-1]|uniref:Uncharacterized protein n=1 Tax=Austropuccinia psidii MF-1 TaxID=1389203 RepID=A0A9Q3BQF9_9BASI|nr:hypothetical protein [Austropuccinia psidii MF-1]